MKKTVALILSTLIIFWACGGGTEKATKNTYTVDRSAELSNYTRDCEVIIIGDSRVNGGGWEEYNNLWCDFGIDGDTAAGVNQRLSAITDKYKTKVVIQVGINDLKNDLSPEYIYYQLQDITNQLTESGSSVFITSTLLSDIPSYNYKINELNLLILEIVNATYIDINESLAPDGYLANTIDGIHLTSSGYDIFFGVIEQI